MFFHYTFHLKFKAQYKHPVMQKHWPETITKPKCFPYVVSGSDTSIKKCKYVVEQLDSNCEWNALVQINSQT